MKVKKALRRLAMLVGWETSYHVSATCIVNDGDYSVISLTMSLSPWMHLDNYVEVIDYVGSKAENIVGRPTITSITKLGA